MQTKIKKKEKGICDIFGCQNEATVLGQTLRFCYEHYSKITANDGSTIENEEFFVGSHKIKKASEYPIRVDLEGEILKEFEIVKKHFGLQDNEAVLKRVINEAYEAMSRTKEKVTPKRVDVPMDADLIAEAKKHNVNIEEAAIQHFEELQKQYPEKKA